MRPRLHYATGLFCRIAAGSCVALLMVTTAWADNPPQNDQIDIGIFTAVEGKVAVTHPGLQSAIPAKIQEGVLFKDVIETDKESRSKALLNDDSILTVGEHSRVEITEHIYDPNKGLRSVVINLVKGKVRALVGKAFTGSGSKFEIHTPSAVAAARGTYFIVFHINGVSGITNVGTHGHVEFSSGGRTVPVPPGHYSVTPPGGGAPSLPAVNTGSNVPPQVASAVQGTEVKDSPKQESPKQMALASGGTAPVMSPSSLTSPAASAPPGGSSGSGEGSGGSGSGEGTGESGGGGSSPSSSSGPTGPTPSGPTGTLTVTVPIVTAAPQIVEQTNPQPPPPVVVPPPPVVVPPPPVVVPPSLTKLQRLALWFSTRISRLVMLFETKAVDRAGKRDLHLANKHYQKITNQALNAEEKAINDANHDYNKLLNDIAKEKTDITTVEAERMLAEAITAAATARMNEFTRAGVEREMIITEASKITKADAKYSGRLQNVSNKYLQKVENVDGLSNEEFLRLQAAAEHELMTAREQLTGLKEAEIRENLAKLREQTEHIQQQSEVVEPHLKIVEPLDPHIIKPGPH